MSDDLALEQSKEEPDGESLTQKGEILVFQRKKKQRDFGTKLEGVGTYNFLEYL